MKKKVITDMMLNIIAAALPVAMLQLVIYPKVAVAAGGEEYGLMLTVYSIWIMTSNAPGNVLNNVKLLKYPQYQAMQEEGDVPILLRRWIVLSSSIVFLATWLYCGEFSVHHLFLGVLVACALMLKAYLEVGFRIKLNYKAILVNNALLSLGFFAGYYLFLKTSYWELIFLTGYALSCTFCAVKTGLLKEAAVKTTLYQSVRSDAYSLLVAAVIGNLINYADKLVLYPLMGGTAVSIYYTATILGKITGMLTGPINSVILSYITRWDNAKASIFSKVLATGFVVICFGYALTLVFSKPVIGYLFPQWVNEVLKIIPITTVTVMLTVLSSILQPFVMKFCNLHWQIVISGVGSLAYFACALILWNVFGLTGFCIGTVIGATVKLILMIIIYRKMAGARN